MDFRKRISVYSGIFFLTSFFLFIFLWSRKENLENLYLLQKTEKVKAEFRATVDGYDKVVYFFLRRFIDNESIKNILYKAEEKEEDKDFLRKELYQNLKDVYFDLKKQGIRYITFYLPDGTVFFRFHKIFRYGDKTVISSINEKRFYKKLGGFRYIFNIFFKNRFVGSVEVSISFGTIRSELNKLFRSEHRFLIKKDIVLNRFFTEERKNYVQSSLSPDFFYEEEKESVKRIPDSVISQINLNIKDKASEFLKKEKSFSLISEVDGDFYVVSFIPVYAQKSFKKEYVGFLVNYEKDNTVSVFSSSFWITYITTNIIIFLLLMMSFFLSYIKEKILIEEIEEKDELEDVYDGELLKEILSHEIERAKRYDRPVSLVAIDFTGIKDLDEEKRKEALKAISGILKENMRKVDFLFVLDDSLFVFLLPETDIQEAGLFAERLKETVEHIYIEDLGKPSFSIGVTEITFDDTPEKAIKRLKEVLYLAEEKGKNSIEMSAV